MESSTLKVPQILRVKVNRGLLKQHKPQLESIFTEEVYVMGKVHPNFVAAEFPREKIEDAKALYDEVRGICAGSRNWFDPEE